MTNNQRHQHYINPAVQKRLMISLMLAELVLISLMLFWLYIDLDALIENNMFKIHIQSTLSAEFIIIRLTKAAIVLLIVNGLVASVIVWYWKSHIKQIISPLDEASNSIRQLDFTATPHISIPHETGDIAMQWFQREKKHLMQIRQLIETMDINEPESLQKKLHNCQHLIEHQG